MQIRRLVSRSLAGRLAVWPLLRYMYPQRLMCLGPSLRETDTEGEGSFTHHLRLNLREGEGLEV